MRILGSAIAFVVVLVVGSAIFDIDPTWQELALVLAAATAADIAAEVLR